MLPTLVDKPPDGEGWLHEAKFDGYRAQAAIADREICIYSRRGRDWTERFESLVGPLLALGLSDAVLDGEAIVADEKGPTDFAALQQALKSRRALAYHVFDLLRLDGRDLRALPLRERKTRLRSLLKAAPPAVRYSDHVEGRGARALTHVCDFGAEGLVSKRADAPYSSGRSSSWVKVKCVRRQETVVGGWRPSDKPGRAFSSLLFGTFDGGKLRYRGRVGTGFDQADQEAIFRQLKASERKVSPFTDAPRDAARAARWTDPKLVVEIRYAELTGEGHFHQPVFLGVRDDIEAAEVTLETPHS